MSIDITVPRSRRALLGAAIGAVAATVATALGRPAPVRAMDPNDVVLGATNTSGTTTLVQNTTTAEAALKGRGITGDGVVGESAGDLKSGVYGFSNHARGYGVFGRNWSGYGYGVGGEGEWGVFGMGSDAGVWGVSADTGVRGDTSPGGDAGVCGTCSGIDLAYDAIGRLGLGDATAVHGWSRTGTAVRAESTVIALDVAGKATFSRSGKATVGAGRSYVDVDLRPKGGLGGSPLILATLQTYRSGIFVAAARKNCPSTGKFRIYLNKAASGTTYVAWMVIG